MSDVAGAALKREIGSATVSAGAAVKALTGQVQGVGVALKGVQPAAAAAMQGLSLLGERVPPQIQAITGAVSGLAAGGFTPLGVAIGALSVGIGLLASQKDEIVSVFAATEERAKSAREALEKVRIELGLLSRGQLPTSRGVDLVGAEDELRRRRLMLSREREAGFLGSEGAGSFFRNVGSGVFPSWGMLPSIDSAVESTTKLVKAQEEHVRVLRETDRLAQEAAKSEAALRAARAMTYDPAKNSSPWYGADPSIERVMSIDPPKEWVEEQRRRDAAISAGVRKLLARQYDPDGTAEGPDPFAGFEIPAGWEEEQSRRDRAIEKAVRSVLARQYDPTDMPSGPDPLDAIMPADPTADAREWQRRAEFVRRMNSDLEETVTLQQQLAGVGTAGLGDALTEGFMSAARGAESFGKSFARVAESVVMDLQRIAIRQIIVNQLVGALTSAFSGSAAAMSKTDQTFVMGAADKHAVQYGGAHADGGSYTVRGTGGPDSQMVMFKATPGERVDFTPPGRERDGGTVVIVENTTGQKSRTERTRGPDGRQQVRVIVGDAAAANIAEGGSIARAIEQSYGLRRAPRRGGN